jgi:hypothetical protein
MPSGAKLTLAGIFVPKYNLGTRATQHSALSTEESSGDGIGYGGEVLWGRKKLTGYVIGNIIEA